jgi:hypothetical protein
VGSNPTPRASLGDSCRNLNSSNEAIFLCTQELVTKTVQISEDKIDSNNIATTCTDLEAKINAMTLDTSKPYFRNVLKKLDVSNHKNAVIICDYITAEITELNIKSSTKEGKIKHLVWLSNYHNRKTFTEMDKNDILSYLNSSRKPLFDDPRQRWIGSYNGRQMILLKFFRWLYNPDESDQRKRMTPPCMQGIKRLTRKEKTRYKSSDIWDAREHAIFLKYCPDKRDRCYHALANDMSARPHEILGLKISDIRFNRTDDGIQYAEVRIRDHEQFL